MQPINEETVNLDITESPTTVDIYQCGDSLNFLVIPAGASVQPLVDDLTTGVAQMLPLSLYATCIDLEPMLSERLYASVRFSLKSWSGTLLRKSELMCLFSGAGLACP